MPAGPAALQLDICVCTRGRPAELRACLNAIQAQRSAIQRVIVSDDSSGAESRLMVAAAFPDTVYLQGPRRGIAANRNHALRHVASPTVLFLDDDAILADDFLPAMTAFIRSGGIDLGRIIITGYEIQRGAAVWPQDQSFLGHQKIPYPPRSIYNTVVINSALFPATLLRRIGFDEKLHYGYEEVDIALRARAAGAGIAFCPAANFHTRSPRSRDGNDLNIDVNRIYVTFKRYAFFERAPAKAVIFLLVAICHVGAFHVKRDGAAGFAKTLRVVGRALWLIILWLARSAREHHGARAEL